MNLIKAYRQRIHQHCIDNSIGSTDRVEYWQDRLFASAVMYIIPLSMIVFVYLLDHLVQQVPLTEIPVIVIEATMEGQHLTISCSANGSTPETGELRDLFRLFYNRAQQPSADSTLNKLAVAKRIIEHLNGELLATEAMTGGLQFIINLSAVKS